MDLKSRFCVRLLALRVGGLGHDRRPRPSQRTYWRQHSDMLLIAPLVIVSGVILPGILAILSWRLKIPDLLNSVLWACNAILRAGFWGVFSGVVVEKYRC